MVNKVSILAVSVLMMLMFVGIASVSAFAQANTMAGSTDSNMMMLYPMIPATPTAPIEIGAGMTSMDDGILNEVMNATDSNFSTVQIDVVNYLQDTIMMLQTQEAQANMSGNITTANMYANWIMSAQTLSDQVNSTSNVTTLQSDIFVFAQMKMSNSINAEILNVQQMTANTNMSSDDMANMTAVIAGLTTLQNDVNQATDLNGLLAAVNNYMATAPVMILTPITASTPAPTAATNSTNSTANPTNVSVPCMNVSQNVTMHVMHHVACNTPASDMVMLSCDKTESSNKDKCAPVVCQPEVCKPETCTTETKCAIEVCKPETCAAEKCTTETKCTTEICKPEVCKPETVTAETCKPEACKTEVCQTETKCKTTECKSSTECNTEKKCDTAVVKSEKCQTEEKKCSDNTCDSTKDDDDGGGLTHGDGG